MSLLLKRNKPNIYRLAGVVIYPGVNEITDEKKIKQMKSYPVYQELIEKRIHEEVTSVKSGKSKTKTNDITEMTANDAISVISETYAIPLLQEMHNRENSKKARSTVLSAIADQIAEMKDTGDDSEEDND